MSIQQHKKQMLKVYVSLSQEEQKKCKKEYIKLFDLTDTFEFLADLAIYTLAKKQK